MNEVKINDDLDERLDIVDEYDRIIGSASRRECNSNPNLIHRAGYVLIFNPEGKLFFQKRSQQKDTCPGRWSISVAGHVSQGETYEKIIVREMKEEIGTVLKVEFLGKFLLRHATESEYSAIFRGYSSGPFEINPKEIEESDFFTMDTIRKKIWGDLTPFSQMVLENLATRDLLSWK